MTYNHFEQKGIARVGDFEVVGEALVVNFSSTATKKFLISFATVHALIDSNAAYHVGAKCPTKRTPPEGSSRSYGEYKSGSPEKQILASSLHKFCLKRLSHPQILDAVLLPFCYVLTGASFFTMM